MTCSVLYFTDPSGQSMWRCPKTFGTKETHYMHETRCWRSNCPGARPPNPTSLCQREGCSNLKRANKDAKYCSDNCRKVAYRMRQKNASLPS